MTQRLTEACSTLEFDELDCRIGKEIENLCSLVRGKAQYYDMADRLDAIWMIIDSAAHHLADHGYVDEAGRIRRTTTEELK